MPVFRSSFLLLLPGPLSHASPSSSCHPPCVFRPFSRPLPRSLFINPFTTPLTTLPDKECRTSRKECPNQRPCHRRATAKIAPPTHHQEHSCRLKPFKDRKKATNLNQGGRDRAITKRQPFQPPRPRPPPPKYPTPPTLVIWTPNTKARQKGIFLRPLLPLRPLPPTPFLT